MKTFYSKTEIVQMISDTTAYSGISEQNLVFERLSFGSVLSGVDVYAHSGRFLVFRELSFISNEQTDGQVTIRLDGTDIIDVHSRATALSDHFTNFTLNGVICDKLTVGAGSLGWYGIFEIWKIV